MIKNVQFFLQVTHRGGHSGRCKDNRDFSVYFFYGRNRAKRKFSPAIKERAVNISTDRLDSHVLMGLSVRAYVAITTIYFTIEIFVGWLNL